MVKHYRNDFVSFFKQKVIADDKGFSDKDNALTS